MTTKNKQKFDFIKSEIAKGVAPSTARLRADKIFGKFGQTLADGSKDPYEVSKGEWV